MMTDIRANFMIVGAQKAGTTALAAFLRAHPSICFSNPKETHFFDCVAGDSQSDSFGDYHDQFYRHFRGEPLAGEATPAYMYSPSVTARLHRYNPELKLIVILRDPVSRAFSHYWHSVFLGNETLTFRQALDAEASRLAQGGECGLTSPALRFSYVDRGRYTRQVERLLSYFPREQILTLRSEELRDRHDETLRRTYEFLDVPYISVPRQTHLAGNYRPMREEERAYLQGVFEGEIRALEDLLGWDLSTWRV